MGVLVGVIVGVFVGVFVGVLVGVFVAVGPGHCPSESDPFITCAVWPLISPASLVQIVTGLLIALWQKHTSFG